MRICMAAETATINTRTSSAAKTPSSYGRITPTQTQADIHPHIHTHIVSHILTMASNPGSLLKPELRFGKYKARFSHLRCHYERSLNSHFPGNPVGLSRYQNVSILDFIRATGDGGGGWLTTDGAIRGAKLQSNVTTNKPAPSLYRPDVLPVTHPTV